MRQGGDPRLPLELALVKVTRPAADLSRESIAFRLEQLETRGRARRPLRRRRPPEQPAGRAGEPEPRPPRRRASSSSSCRRRGRARSLPAVAEQVDPDLVGARRGAPVRARGRHAHASSSRASASFHRQLAEEPKNATLLRDALYEVTGRRLALEFAVGEAARRRGAPRPKAPAGEERILELMKETFDAQRGEKRMSFDMNKLMQQAAQMQEQVQKMQEEAEKGDRRGLGRRRHGQGDRERRRRGALDRDLARRDRPRRSGGARRPRARGRERGAALGVRRGRGEGAADARISAAGLPGLRPHAAKSKTQPQTTMPVRASTMNAQTPVRAGDEPHGLVPRPKGCPQRTATLRRC